MCKDGCFLLQDFIALAFRAGRLMHKIFVVPLTLCTLLDRLVARLRLRCLTHTGAHTLLERRIYLIPTGLES